MVPQPLPRALLLAGITAWLGVSVATAIEAPLTQRLLAWACASVVFVSAFLWTTRTARRPFIAVALQSAFAISMTALFCNGYEGLLLVLLAAQLGFSAGARLGFGLIVVQSVALTLAVALQWHIRAPLFRFPATHVRGRAPVHRGAAHERRGGPRQCGTAANAGRPGGEESGGRASADGPGSARLARPPSGRAELESRNCSA